MEPARKSLELIIDIDLEEEYNTHVHRVTIATKPLVKWCTIEYMINKGTKGFAVIVRIKYKGIKKPFDIKIDRLEQDTMYKLYDALLHCIKYKVVEYEKTNSEPLKYEPISEPTMNSETSYRYITLKLTPKVVVLNLFDFDDTHVRHTFERIN